MKHPSSLLHNATQVATSLPLTPLQWKKLLDYFEEAELPVKVQEIVDKLFSLHEAD